MSISGLFGQSDRESPEAVISKQIQALSIKVDQLFGHIDQHMADVKHMMQEHHKAMMGNFDQVFEINRSKKILEIFYVIKNSISNSFSQKVFHVLKKTNFFENNFYILTHIIYFQKIIYYDKNLFIKCKYKEIF